MIKEQAFDAYLRMAQVAKYRPMAPSDGWGNVTVPLEKLNLNDEATRYANKFAEEEGRQEYWVGCASSQHQTAVVFLVEALRALSGVQPDLALKLVHLAEAEIKANPDCPFGSMPS